MHIKNLAMMIKFKKLTTTIPPKSGPTPQGLNIKYNTVTIVNPEKTSNGRNRQVVTKRSR